MEDQKESKLVSHEIPKEMALLPTGETVVYPYTVVPMVLLNEALINAVDYAMSKERIIGAFAIKPKDNKEEKLEKKEEPPEIFDIGTAAVIHKMLKMPDGSMRLIVQGLSKVRIKNIFQKEPFLKAEVEVIQEPDIRTEKIEALKRNILGLYHKMVKQVPYMPEELEATAMNIEEPIKLVYFIASMIKMNIKDRQEILEIDDPEEKLKKLLIILERELELLELGGKIQSEIQSKLDKSQREFFLRQQLKAIQEELGELDEVQAEIKEFREKLENSNLPEVVAKEAFRELSRLEKLQPASAEYGVIRTYLEWIIELPWNKSTKDNLDLKNARRILDEDHYDLDEVKDRIIEYLAIRKLKEDMKGPILCFVGPPGVGKTSLGQSIARALGRKFIRMSLGGMHDEAEIRGHRRTYIGAMPGRIIQYIRRAESSNPVFMLDEIDKVGADYRGDPSSALLEVLDPEQNSTFTDHYLNVPFDLSKVMFITTANIMETIQPALRDRMEIIHISGYTDEEKVWIAKKYLLPRQIKENGLEEDDVIINRKVLLQIISEYTKEAGVRNLERELAKICRKVAKQKIETGKGKVIITKRNLKKFLGPQKVFPEVAMRTSRPGVVTGLAWTEAGGDILFIEASKMPGEKGFTLTGHLGQVMQESAGAALSYVRANAEKLGIDKDFFKKYDIHVHVPAGAIPKDGPSAGITIATAIASLLTNRPARADVAMTGEITLSGLVLPIGGVKEKVLAAKRAGIRNIILPARNKNDVEEINKELKKGMNFIFVETIDEVFEHALTEPKEKDKEDKRDEK